MPNEFDYQDPQAIPAAQPPKQDDQVSLEDFEEMARQKYGIPKNLLKSMVGQESGGDWGAKSPTGVKGKYQVTEATAKQYGLDRNDPFQQTVAAMKHLRNQFDALGNVKDTNARWLSAVGRYYGGDSAVDPQGGISTKSPDGVSNPLNHMKRVADTWKSLGLDGAPDSQAAQAPAVKLAPVGGRLGKNGEFILNAGETTLQDEKASPVPAIAQRSGDIGTATAGMLAQKGLANNLSEFELANPGKNRIAVSIPGQPDKLPTQEEAADLALRSLQVPEGFKETYAQYGPAFMQSFSPENLAAWQKAGYLRYEPESQQWQMDVDVPDTITAAIENFKNRQPLDSTQNTTLGQKVRQFAGGLAQNAPNLVAGLEGAGAGVAKTISNVSKLATLQNPQTAPENALDRYAQGARQDVEGVNKVDPSMLGQLERGLVTGAVTMPMINELVQVGGLPAMLTHGILSRGHLAGADQIKGVINDIATIKGMHLANTLPGAVQAGVGGLAQTLGRVGTGDVKNLQSAVPAFLEGVAMSPAARQRKSIEPLPSIVRPEGVRMQNGTEVVPIDVAKAAQRDTAAREVAQNVPPAQAPAPVAPQPAAPTGKPQGRFAAKVAARTAPAPEVAQTVTPTQEVAPVAKPALAIAPEAKPVAASDVEILASGEIPAFEKGKRVTRLNIDGQDVLVRIPRGMHPEEAKIRAEMQIRSKGVGDELQQPSGIQSEAGTVKANVAKETNAPTQIETPAKEAPSPLPVRSAEPAVEPVRGNVPEIAPVENAPETIKQTAPVPPTETPKVVESPVATEPTTEAPVSRSSDIYRTKGAKVDDAVLDKIDERARNREATPEGEERPVGEHGRISYWSHRGFPVEGSDQRTIPLSSQPGLRKYLGLPQIPEGADGATVARAQQHTLDALAEAMGKNRSSEITPEDHANWLHKHGVRLPHEVRNAYAETLAQADTDTAFRTERGLEHPEVQAVITQLRESGALTDTGVRRGQKTNVIKQFQAVAESLGLPKTAGESLGRRYIESLEGGLPSSEKADVSGRGEPETAPVSVEARTGPAQPDTAAPAEARAESAPVEKVNDSQERQDNVAKEPRQMTREELHAANQSAMQDGDRDVARATFDELVKRDIEARPATVRGKTALQERQSDADIVVPRLKKPIGPIPDPEAQWEKPAKSAPVEQVKPSAREKKAVASKSQDEKINARTGLTKSQEAYLTGKLQDVALSMAEPHPVEIQVPGDGSFKVKNAGEVVNLHKRITGKGIPALEGVVEPTVSRASSGTGMATAPNKPITDIGVLADRAMELYGAPRNAIKELERTAAIFEDNRPLLDNVINELMVRSDGRSNHGGEHAGITRTDRRGNKVPATYDLKRAIREYGETGSIGRQKQESASMPPPTASAAAPTDFTTSAFGVGALRKFNDAQLSTIASHFKTHSSNFVAWGKAMIADFGASIRPKLREIWDGLRKFHADELGSAKASPGGPPIGESVPKRAAKAKIPLPADIDLNTIAESADKIISKGNLNEAKQAKAEEAFDRLLAAHDNNDAVEFARAQQKLQSIIAGTKTNTALAVLRAGLLTSPKTHLRNTLGNSAEMALDMAADLPGSIADIVASAVTGRRALTASAGKGSWEGAKAGLADAKKVMRTGLTDTEMAKFEMHGAVDPDSIAGKYTSFIFRSMAAEDRVFKGIAYNRAIENQAQAVAKTEARQGLIKKDEIANRQKVLTQAPTEEMQAQAIHDADVLTFNNANPLATSFSNWQAQASKPAQVVSTLLVPFVRTPTNIVARMFEASPFGYAKNVGQVAKAVSGARSIQKASPETSFKEAVSKAFTVAEQRSFSQTFGRATVGTALLALGYALGKKGLASAIRDYDEMDDLSKIEADKVTGRTGGAVKIGGHWFQIANLPPGGALIALGATFARESEDTKKAGIWDRAQEHGKTVLKAGLDQPLVHGVEELMKIAKPKGFERLAASKLAMTVPTIVGDVAGLGDTKDRKPEGLTGQLKKRIPGLRNTLPEQKDAFGQSIPFHKSRAIDIFNSVADKTGDSPALQEVARLDMGIGKSRLRNGESPDQLQQRMESAGKLFTERANDLVGSAKYQAYTDAQKREALEQLLKAEKVESSRRIPLPRQRRARLY